MLLLLLQLVCGARSRCSSAQMWLVCSPPVSQLVYRADDLKKPLRVTFVTGGVPEPAQDEGGVTKE